MVIRRIMLALLLWAYVSSALSQVVQNRDRTLTTADGLPNSTITGLVQDRTGFVWIATADGLARYDGQRMKIFRQANQPNSLLESNITRLQNLSDGTLLLQTSAGDFQRFDPLTERFSLFLPLDKQGKRKLDEGWLAPDGKTFCGLWRGEKIQFFDQHLHSIYTWDHRNLGIAANTLHSVMVATTGQVYAHSDKGLIELNPKTGQYCLLPFAGPVKRRLNTITPVIDWAHVVERPNGEIMVIGQQCLHIFNPKTRQFRELVMPGPFAPKGAYALRVLADGKVYLGIGRHLYELLPNDQFALVHTGELPVGEQLAYGMPCLFDRSSVLWLYNQAGKITMLNRLAQPFRTYPYHTNWTSDLLQIGLGMEPSQKSGRGSDSWTRFTQLRDKLWFIDNLALYRWASVSHTIQLTSSFITGDSCVFKIVLKPDQREHLWIYGNEKGGLTEMDSVGRVKRFWPNSLVPQPLEKRGLDVADIQPMANTVWMASYQGRGLYKYDLRQKKIVGQWLHNSASSQSLPTNQLLCLTADPHQPTVLWIGTKGGGLTRFDTRTGRFRTFTGKDGLPSNTINSLLTDVQGVLWAGTNNGLVSLDTRSFRMRWFSRADGLQDDEFGYAMATRLPDGQLAFGGRTGLTIFNPTSLHDDTFEPPIVLTGLHINNSSVEAGQVNSPLLKTINTLTELTLDHTQNFLTFAFAALQYSKPEKIKYRYRLVGVDPDWINADGQQTANYTQLAPDHYQFEVMATNAQGRWSRHIKRLAIVIAPPFWASWWAYALYALLFGGTIVGFVQFRIRQGRQAQEMELRRREANQLKAVDELKTRFSPTLPTNFVLHSP
jgi:streptogramin lyase